MSAAKNKIRVLFLCTGNSCRSQMAEGWAKHLINDRVESFSAGVVRHGMNQIAVKVMAEAGVDISGQESKTIEELPRHDFDWVITLCSHADKNCPVFPGKKLHRGFEDPPTQASKAKSAEEVITCYRDVRDQIRKFIETLPEYLFSQEGGED